MAYTLGTAANAAALKSAIETFATANGWTLDASGTIWKGSNFVRLFADSTEKLRIAAANSIDFATEPCPQAQRIWIASVDWPVNYYLFCHTSPDQIVCVVNYRVVRHQWLAFGTMTKAGSWVGGNWFGASSSTNDSVGVGPDEFNLQPISSGGGGEFNPAMGSPAMFWNCTNNFSYGGNGLVGQRNTHLHCKLGGSIWPGAGSFTDPFPSFPQYADPIHRRTPNSWNGQAVLTPMWLFLPRVDGYVSPLGHIEHIRSLRITNYNSGDVITIGADKWKVFPWCEKSTSEPDGNSYSNHSGTFGFAVRYDGP